MQFLEWIILDNSLRRWLLAGLVALLTAVLIQGGRRLLLRHLQKLVRRTRNEVDDVAILLVQKVNSGVVLLLSLYAGLLALTIPASWMDWINAAAFIVFLTQVGIWGNELIHYWLIREPRQDLAEDADRVTTLNGVSFVIRLLLFSILILLALDNIPGVEVTALITGLGIGGVAVALAVQNILADLFASLSIALDKPFVLGDFIIVGDQMGTVEHIGLKTTRLRSLWGEELVFANNDLLTSRIRNYKDMEERRVTFQFGVTYDTAPAQLRQIPPLVTDIIQGLEQTRFDRAHFKGFGDYALDFEIVYYVLAADYNLYMDIQQAINLALLEQFAAAGIEFAYPTQTLHLAGAPDQPALQTAVATTADNGQEQHQQPGHH